MLNQVNDRLRYDNGLAIRSKRWLWLGFLSATAIVLTIASFGLWSVSYYRLELFAGLRADFSSNGRTVTVNGHVMGSMFCVGSLDHREQNGELNLRMRYRLICPGQRSGDFSIVIPTSGTVHEVTYGDEHAPLLKTANRDSN